MCKINCNMHLQQRHAKATYMCCFSNVSKIFPKIFPKLPMLSQRSHEQFPIFPNMSMIFPKFPRFSPGFKLFPNISKIFPQLPTCFPMKSRSPRIFWLAAKVRFASQSPQPQARPARAQPAPPCRETAAPEAPAMAWMPWRKAQG